MSQHTKNFVAAVFDNDDRAHAFVEDMIKHDLPMDQVSMLHKAGGHSD